MTKRIPLILFLVFLFLAIITRFYDISWGAPFFFHPDERNIAASISQLHFPLQLNPHFFAYGSLPIYTAYLSGILVNVMTSCKFFTVHCSLFSVQFETAILILRFFSALFSCLLLWLLFLTGRELKNKKTGTIAAFFGLTSIGLIQYAHFGTFEMWLTFFSTMLFFWSLLFWYKPSIKLWLGIAVCFAILMATKVSSLDLLPLAILVLATPALKERKHHYLKRGAYLLVFLGLSGLLYLLTNPFVLLDFHSFLNSMNYESGVALGVIPVFYTGEFLNAPVILFHLLHVYPFLLGPLMMLLMLPSLGMLLMLTLRQKQFSYLLLLLYTAVLFFSQAFLFVRWTRYVVPTLPFFYLIIALFVTTMWQRARSQSARAISIALVVCLSLFFAFAFFKTDYLSGDTRVKAAAFAQNHLPQNTHVLSEVYDLGIIPFNNDFPNITLFNFYDLDNNSPVNNQQSLNQLLSTTDAIVLPSQRIAKIRLLDAKHFPIGHQFYADLFSGKLGFHKIYQTPCDFFCTITYWGDPVFSFEETATVFDRPTLSIFKRT